MIEPKLPLNEEFRLEALNSLNILDSNSEKEFDDITALATYICETETALISLVDEDRIWYKSYHGLQAMETNRKLSFCAHAILTPTDPLIIPDARLDKRFSNSSFAIGTKKVVFYVGIPLVDKNGFSLGTLCVMDSKPKELSEKQIQSLKSLANQVVILFELNKKNHNLNKMQLELQKKNESLKEFARVISHDLKMPLANVITTSDLLKFKLEGILDAESLEYFDYIHKSSFSMSDYINDILRHYESDSLIQNQPESFEVNELLEEIKSLLGIGDESDVSLPKDNPVINCSKSALKQILFNLMANSIKYNDKDIVIINIDYGQDDVFYYFRVTDNGMGIPEEQLETIFDLFTTANTADKNGNKGNGIGLSTVKKIVENLGGSIKVQSILGKQTSFNFSIKKQPFDTN